MSSLLQDLRYAFRAFRNAPVFSTIAVLTLALGVGANTAIYTLVNAVLLRPLPYSDADRLVRLTWQTGRGNVDLTVPQFKFYRDHSHTFESVTALRGYYDAALKVGTATQWVRVQTVSDGFFETFNAPPVLGRGFVREETDPQGPRSLVLSYGLWQRPFASDPSIVGRQLVVDGEGYTVVGVAPRDFTFVEAADMFIPVRMGNSVSDQGFNTEAVARLKPGIPLAQAQSEMNAIFAQFRGEYGASARARGVQLFGYQQWLVGDISPTLRLLFAAVAFLLVIACANIASLLFARLISRQREIAIRRALGAGAFRILSQLLSESLFVAVFGSAIGLAAAVWLLRTLLVSVPWNLPSITHISVDRHVLLFTLLLAAGATVAFGLVSYVQAVHFNVNNALKEGGGSFGGGPSRNRFRQALSVAEVAFSVVLLIGAGLLIGSLYRLFQQKLGFDPQNVVSMQTPFAAGKYSTKAAMWQLERQVLERIQALPGVSSAAVVSNLPLTGHWNLPTQHEGHPEDSIGGMEYRLVSPRYFETMRIPVLQGRAFSDADNSTSQPAVLVNETLAHTWWAGHSPIGDRVLVGRYEGQRFPDIEEPPREIVGVVGDVKVDAVGQRVPPMIYVPAAQNGNQGGGTAWVIRVNDRVNIDRALRQAVAAVDPEQRVLNMRSLSEIVEHSVAQPRFSALLMSLFAGLALLLSAIGLYGVISYFVSQRTHEIGLRVALGARRDDVAKLVIRQGLSLTVIGIAIGLMAAFGATRFLSSMLYGVRSTDLTVFVAVSVFLLTVCLLACAVPAFRATKVDAMVALRYE